jgi:hypothetical protein
MTTTAIYEKIRDQGALFNVRTEPLFTESGQRVPQRVAIVNAESNQPLSVVSTKYKVVSNEQVVRATLDAIDRAHLDTTDADVIVQNGAHGAKSMVRIQLPAYSILAGGNQTNLEIVTLNSYDGSWKYVSRAGGIRMACLNGQVMGKMIGTYSQYHNASLNVERGAEQLVRMISDFTSSEEWFNMMMGRKVTVEDVEQLACRFINIPLAHKDDSRMVKKLLELYDAYAREMGANAYAVYNAFTDFITHRSRHKTSVATSRLYDENRFTSEILTAKVFN